MVTRINIYRAGLVVGKVLKRCDMNIFKTIRFLDRARNRRPSGACSAADLLQIDIWNRYVYYLSPWMWGHECLYRSLLFYRFCADKTAVNIGLRIDYQKTKMGHCWITADGKTVDRRDDEYAIYYAKFFTQKRNVFYWLPVDSNKNQKFPIPVLEGKPPAPQSVKLRIGRRS